ncbi:hypothetical protein BDY19DRAFT_991241 [Irpex rosettiformis]|uniref:Uncharacterized protein n=1 Tax=Irpex rosettiformis TaxID=378272 RepID=A0ACB8UB20_9APHY|nr:hypothetical protein BDY19DRAFT_991241 [Irpex rosettiformis]
MSDSGMNTLFERYSNDPPPLSTDKYRVRMTTYIGFVSFAILIWDHMITFADEVEYIWKGQKRNPFVWLFLLNRYVTPLGFIVNLLAYMSNLLTPERFHYVVYEGSTTVVGINIVALMMLLRIRALYRKQTSVTVFVALCFCVELGVNAWLLSHAVPVAHNKGVSACTMIFDESVGWAASAFAWLPLAYDTIVFGLTMYSTLVPTRKKTAGKLSRVMLTDGILYYSVILTVNLVLTIMLVAAPPGLQNICSQLAYLLTVTMMSRITLSLRKRASTREVDPLLCSMKSFTCSTPHFVHRSRGATHTTDLNVSIVVQASTTTHDDQGDVIDIYQIEDSLDDIAESERRKNSSGDAYDWYQLRPPAPVIGHLRPTQGMNDTDVVRVV